MGEDETSLKSQESNPFYELDNDAIFLKVLRAFKPNSTFERNLVKGEILRQENPPSIEAPTNDRFPVDCHNKLKNI